MAITAILWYYNFERTVPLYQHTNKELYYWVSVYSITLLFSEVSYMPSCFGLAAIFEKKNMEKH